MSIDEITRLLVDEALGERETGWLSDLGGFDLEFAPSERAITLEGWGSIDIGQLAGIILDLIESA
jgi:hypothetical protein